jgi:hypothetical protein
MVPLLAIFSPVQAIILAEAGVKARAENIAAVINIFIGHLAENETSVLLVIGMRIVQRTGFQKKDNFCVLRRNEAARFRLRGRPRASEAAFSAASLRSPIARLCDIVSPPILSLLIAVVEAGLVQPR